MIILYILLGIIAIVALWFALLWVSGLFIDTSKE